MKVLKNKSWTNVAKLHTAKPKTFYRPESYADLVAAVKEAESRKCHIRAVGSGHTSTDAAITNDILLDLCLLNQVAYVDKSSLKVNRRKEFLVRMDAGANIDTFNDRLDDMGLAFQSLGIIDHQTISGAIATGTHGNCPSLPGFPGLVKSILLVAAGGKMYRIEPTDGVTDPALHKEQGVQLIQNDFTFRCALVHMGAFGIVASYIIEVEPQYWLMEKRTVERWSDIAQQVRQGTLFRDYPVEVDGKVLKHPVLGLHIAVNPHEVDGDHLCMVGRFFKFKNEPDRNLGDRLRSPLPTLLANTMIPSGILVRQANRNPEKLPNTIQTGLKAMADKSYINKSYKVWNQGIEGPAEKTYGCEFAFDGTNPKWLDAMEALFAKAKALAKDNLYASNTLMVRYSKKSPAYIAPDSEHELVAWIGTPVPGKVTRGPEILNAHQEVCAAHGGKSHWGKMNNRVTPAMIKAWYPQLPAWRAEMRKFNPNGTFNNAFTDRFGLTKEI